MEYYIGGTKGDTVYVVGGAWSNKPNGFWVYKKSTDILGTTYLEYSHWVEEKPENAFGPYLK